MRNYGLRATAVAAIALVASTHASAQSSVTLGGMIDAGVTYINNQHGSSNTAFDSGILAPSLFTMRGTEDLGGGTRAIFDLTSQFDVGSGATIPGAGQIFSRTAFVGLANDKLGTVTLGNQYELMFETLAGNHYDGALLFGGLYDFRNGPFAKLGIPNNPTGAFDFDRMAGGTRVNNSVKYKSPDFYGVNVAALYGFSNVAGGFSSSNTVSLGANYSNGPFGIGAAYTDQKYAALNDGHDGIRNFGVGTHYAFGPVLAMLLYTNTKNTASGAKIDVYKIGAKWDIDNRWTTGLDYTYMRGNAALDHNKAHQVAAALQYHFSKRTHVYVQGVYQHASGDDSSTGAWINGLTAADAASSTGNQALARVGLFVTF